MKIEIGKWVDNKYGTGATFYANHNIYCSCVYDSLKPKNSDEFPFIINVNGIRLKNRFENFEKGKEFALLVLKKWVVESHNLLSNI